MIEGSQLIARSYNPNPKSYSLLLLVTKNFTPSKQITPELHKHFNYHTYLRHGDV